MDDVTLDNLHSVVQESDLQYEDGSMADDDISGKHLTPYLHIENNLEWADNFISRTISLFSCVTIQPSQYYPFPSITLYNTFSMCI